MTRRSKPAAANSLRIIGGQWRGRKLAFPSLEGLRPTPDRVRETLFNWLAPDLHGARCLDLYSGSGALGLEALSRQVGEVGFVERAAQAAQHIRQHLETLQATDRAQVVQQDCLHWLQQAQSPLVPFDIVFMDPPFNQGLAEPTCQQLAALGYVQSGSLVYLETEAEAEPRLPGNWQPYRSKTAGQVTYSLFEVE